MVAQSRGGGPVLDPRHGRLHPTGWVGVIIMWLAEANHGLPALVSCGQHVKLSDVSSQYSLLVDKDVKKPTKQTKPFIVQKRFALHYFLLTAICLVVKDYLQYPLCSLFTERNKENAFLKLFIRWTCWTPKYKVFDAQNQVVFTIVGECCYCKCCADVIFHVSLIWALTLKCILLVHCFRVVFSGCQCTVIGK